MAPPIGQGHSQWPGVTLLYMYINTMIEIIEIIDAGGPHDREIIEAASHSDRANLSNNAYLQRFP